MYGGCSWMGVICGPNPGNLDPEGSFPLFLRYLPAGTSVLNMAHWSQVWLCAGGAEEGGMWACMVT
jgi:hypothetical protein